MNRVTLMLCLAFSLVLSFQMQASRTSMYQPNDLAPFVNGGSKLAPNQFLTKDQYLKSPNGKYTLYYQADGNFVLYTNGLRDPSWSSRTNGTAPGKVLMLADGHLVIYNASNQAIWSSASSAYPNQGHFLEMRNDGNAVIRKNSYQQIWETKTGGTKYSGGPVLYGNQFMGKGQRITSANGQYFLNYQHDGNLVLYKTQGTQALWNTSTHGKASNITRLDDHGNLEIKYRDIKVWSSNSGKRPFRFCRLVVENNGKLVIYWLNYPIWSVGGGV